MSSINILLADDSPIFVAALTGILEADGDMKVAWVAENGIQAHEMTANHSPDLVVMDVHMPEMGGLEAIEEIMATTPTPILVLTSDPRAETSDFIFDAIERGALELIRKPAEFDPQAADAKMIRNKARLLSGVAVVRRAKKEARLRAKPAWSVGAPQGAEGDAEARAGATGRLSRVIGVVSSTGGPAALAGLLEFIPSGFEAPFVVVQHLSPGFSETFASWLDSVSALSASVAQQGARLKAGHVYVAPDGHHLEVDETGALLLIPAEAGTTHVPSGTRLLESIARSYGRRSIGVVLTGMGNDGAVGMQRIKERGGVTMVQSPDTCVVASMPQAAISLGCVDAHYPTDDLANAVIAAVRGCVGK